MTNYRLVYTKRALKDIKKLDSIAQSRLKLALEKFASDPLGYSTKLTDSKLGEYRFRVGSLRIIFDLNKKDILVLRIGHRREIYQK
jgi:mRNA interferase RelE/StbE